MLPQHPKYLVPEPLFPREGEPAVDPTPVKLPDRQTVENIGRRIRQLRESRNATQSQLQRISRVSRSYLSRIESGQMTPSLGTLEKIGDALKIGLNRFFISEMAGEAMLEDPFIQGLGPYLRQLRWTQWISILTKLRAIGDHENKIPATLLPIGKPGQTIQNHCAPTVNRT